MDDDPGLRAVLAATLGHTYRLEQAVDGADGLAAARAVRPDLILLDIAMPGMSGFETCMLLKREEATRGVPVIFLSALAQADDRLAAYEAGGEDFLGKPFDPDELLDKVEITLAHAAERERLASEAQNAFATAMTAMVSASELGGVMRFMRRSFACASLEELAATLIEAAAGWGLVASVQLRASRRRLSHNQDGVSSPLEESVLSTLSECGRLVSLKDRLAVNYPAVTLMIANMPISDAERCGRLRDDLALLAEAADSRVHALNNELAVETQRAALQKLMERTRATLTDLDGRYRRQKVQAIETLYGLLDEMENAFTGLGLTDAQEASIAAMLRNAVDHVLGLYEQGLPVDRHLGTLADELDDGIEAART